MRQSVILKRLLLDRFSADVVMIIHNNSNNDYNNNEVNYITPNS